MILILSCTCTVQGKKSEVVKSTSTDVLNEVRPKLEGSRQGWGRLQRHDYDYDYDYTTITKNDYDYDYSKRKLITIMITNP